jgi:phosphoribosylamine--glycine ligase
MASRGYPREFERGLPIEGLEEAGADPDVVVFHAGTRRGDDGRFVTAGGRVLGVTARGVGIAEARRRAYAATQCIRFEGAHVRGDIASRAIS